MAELQAETPTPEHGPDCGCFDCFSNYSPPLKVEGRLECFPQGYVESLRSSLRAVERERDDWKARAANEADAFDRSNKLAVQAALKCAEELRVARREAFEEAAQWLDRQGRYVTANGIRALSPGAATTESEDAHG